MWRQSLTGFTLLFSKALSAPIEGQFQNPSHQSTDVWATVIANAAPLMALVGERNAKEFMRTVSNWHQLLLLSCAPLGILAISVSSIRLSGPGFLKRLVGRDSERRSEALVEVTPLSVRPATSVYTPRAVEIEDSFSKDNFAFICAHVRDADANEAVESFKDVFERHVGSIDDDKDAEGVLAIWFRKPKLEEVAGLLDYLEGNNTSSPLRFPSDVRAAICYRTTGISPTQRVTQFGHSWMGVRNLLASMVEWCC